MSSGAVRIVIVDDSAIVRTGLRTLIGLDEALEIVGEAEDGDEAVELVTRTRPDVTLLDVRMPRRDGLSTLTDIAGITRVVMLTFTDEPATIHRALRDGALGYLVHGTFDADSLAATIRAVAAGSGAFSGPALDVLRGGSAAPAPGERPRSTFGLSARQAEVMGLIAAGRSNVEIAKELFLAEKTVKNHINQIFAILGVTSRAQAIVLWLDPPPAS